MANKLIIRRYIQSAVQNKNKAISLVSIKLNEAVSVKMNESISLGASKASSGFLGRKHSVDHFLHYLSVNRS